MTKPLVLEIVSKNCDRAFKVFDLISHLDRMLKERLCLPEKENLKWELTNDHPATMARPVGQKFYRTKVSIVRELMEDPVVAAETNLITSSNGRPHLEIFSDSVDDTSPLAIAQHLYECLALNVVGK